MTGMDGQSLVDLTIHELLQRYQYWAKQPWNAREPSEWIAGYGRFAVQFAGLARVFTEMTAWARLGAAVAGGQDAPPSIYVLDGEDPADTARWRQWRIPPLPE